jgi:hypothetical protein
VSDGEVKEAMRATVDKQVEVGFDVINDGDQVGLVVGGVVPSSAGRCGRRDPAMGSGARRRGGRMGMWNSSRSITNATRGFRYRVIWACTSVLGAWHDGLGTAG